MRIFEVPMVRSALRLALAGALSPVAFASVFLFNSAGEDFTLKRVAGLGPMSEYDLTAADAHGLASPQSLVLSDKSPIVLDNFPDTPRGHACWEVKNGQDEVVGSLCYALRDALGVTSSTPGKLTWIPSGPLGFDLDVKPLGQAGIYALIRGPRKMLKPRRGSAPAVVGQEESKAFHPSLGPTAGLSSVATSPSRLTGRRPSAPGGPVSGESKSLSSAKGTGAGPDSATTVKVRVLPKGLLPFRAQDKAD